MLERFLEIKSANLKALIDIKAEQMMANVKVETVTTIVAGLKPVKTGLEKLSSRNGTLVTTEGVYCTVHGWRKVAASVSHRTRALKNYRRHSSQSCQSTQAPPARQAKDTNVERLRYKSSETRKGPAQRCSDHHWPKNTCPRDIVLFEVDLQPLSLRRRACLTKYYNKLRNLDSRNSTSAYFKDWCNNQRLRRSSPFSQMVSFNLTIGAVEPHHLSQCLDPADDLDGVLFHPELPVNVNKQAALERIEDIPIDAVQVYTDSSRDDYYRPGSGIYIKLQDHIISIQRRNPDGCSVFHSELIAIDERTLVLLHLFQMEKRFGYCLIVDVQYSTCPIGKV
ncbi:uncharacterized protein TNCV_4068001 [Trichonephila clavipes]|nr:uncharacterized protein TNCV_4068001 [Trichonephila clavipes]